MQPRVMVIEYNAVFRPPVAVVAEYNRTLYGMGQATTERALRPSRGWEQERVTRLLAVHFPELTHFSSGRIWWGTNSALRSLRRITSSRPDSDSTKRERLTCTRPASANMCACEDMRPADGAEALRT